MVLKPFVKDSILNAVADLLFSPAGESSSQVLHRSRSNTHLHVRPRLVYGIAIWLAVLWLCVHVAGVVYNSLLGGVVLLVPVRN